MSTPSRPPELQLSLAVRGQHLSFLETSERARAATVCKAWQAAAWYGPIPRLRLTATPPPTDRLLLHHIKATVVSISTGQHFPWTRGDMEMLSTLLSESKCLLDVELCSSDPFHTAQLSLLPDRPFRRCISNIASGGRIPPSAEWWRMQCATIEVLHLEHYLSHTLRHFPIDTALAWSRLTDLRLVDENLTVGTRRAIGVPFQCRGHDVFPVLQTLHVEAKNLPLARQALESFRDWWPSHPTLTRFALVDACMCVEMTRATPKTPFVLQWSPQTYGAHFHVLAPTPVPTLVLPDQPNARSLAHYELNASDTLDIGVYWRQLVTCWTVPSPVRWLRLRTSERDWRILTVLDDLLKLLTGDLVCAESVAMRVSWVDWKELPVLPWPQLDNLLRVVGARHKPFQSFHVTVALRNETNAFDAAQSATRRLELSASAARIQNCTLTFE